VLFETAAGFAGCHRDIILANSSAFPCKAKLGEKKEGGGRRGGLVDSRKRIANNPPRMPTRRRKAPNTQDPHLFILHYFTRSIREAQEAGPISSTVVRKEKEGGKREKSLMRTSDRGRGDITKRGDSQFPKKNGGGG